MPPPYDACVFVNCPYCDIAYKPILDAVIFTIHYCGFVAKLALDKVGTEDNRLEKIKEMISESRYSIHDFSIVDKPRLNMPFEAGICFGAKFFGDDLQKGKYILVLDSELHRYKDTISDLSGHDAECHKNDPAEAIRRVRKFLANKKSGESGFVGAEYILRRYRQFQKTIPTAAKISKRTVKELNSWDYIQRFLYLFVTYNMNITEPERACPRTIRADALDLGILSRASPLRLKH